MISTEQKRRAASQAPRQSTDTIGETIVGFVVGLIILGCGWWFLTTPLAAQLVAIMRTDSKLAWHISRGSGTVAYGLLAASTIWGLMLTTKLVKAQVSAPFTLAIHNILSWLAISFSAVHALLLLFDGYYHYTLANLVIPFTGPYLPAWVGIGIIGLYIMLVTSISFAWRGWMGQTLWRRLHYFTYAAFGLVTIHGLMAGTDSSDPAMRLLFWGSTIIILVLTVYRFTTVHQTPASTSANLSARHRHRA